MHMRAVDAAMIQDFRARFKVAVKECLSLLQRYNEDRARGLNRTDRKTWTPETSEEAKFKAGLDLVAYRVNTLKPLKDEGQSLGLDLSQEFALAQQG